MLVQLLLSARQSEHDIIVHMLLTMFFRATEQTESLPNEEEEQREEGQSETDEEGDDDEEEEEGEGKCSPTGEKEEKSKDRRKKRRRRSLGHRHNLKSKFDGLEGLNPDALSAQSEELERIRRLELQQSLLDAPESSTSSRRDSTQKER